MNYKEVIKEVVGKRALEYKLILNSKLNESKLVRGKTLGITFWDEKKIFVCKKRIKMDWNYSSVKDIRKWIGGELLRDIILFVALHEYAHITHYLTGHFDLDHYEKDKGYAAQIEYLADRLALKWFKKLKKKEVI